MRKQMGSVFKTYKYTELAENILLKNKRPVATLSEISRSRRQFTVKRLSKTGSKKKGAL